MIQIPQKLRQRPRHGPLPIPFTTFIGPDGIPDFKVIDEYCRLLCIQRRFCSLCGMEMNRKKPIVFVGGEQSCTTGKFIDPAMHEECVMYAVKVCPYLTGDHTHRPEISKNAAGVYTGVTVDRPVRMGLYYTMSYKAIAMGDNGEDGIYLQAAQALKIDWDTIPPGPPKPDPVATEGAVTDVVTADSFVPKGAVMNLPDVSIVYDEYIAGPKGPIIARLRSDGTMQIGYDGQTLHETVFYQEVRSGRPWIPSQSVFIDSIKESLAAGEYDLDGERANLQSFVDGLRRHVAESSEGEQHD